MEKIVTTSSPASRPISSASPSPSAKAKSASSPRAGLRKKKEENIVRYRLSELNPPQLTKEQRERLDRMTEAEIVANAKSDPDNPPLTAAQLRNARPPIPHPNVRRIRKSLNLTQSGFAFRFGFDVTALRDWEQGRRKPDRAARILLSVIEHEPKAVDRALRASQPKKRRK